MNGVQYTAAQMHTPDAKALARRRRAEALKARAAKLDSQIAALVAQNAGMDEITATLGCHQSRVYMWASREKTRVPPRRQCRPFNRGLISAPGTPAAELAVKTLHVAPNAMKAQAAMFRLLDTHFDPDAGRYNDGWDDARVAKESGMAPGFVAEFRKQGFGEIKSSPELQAIASDLKTLKAMVADLETRLSKAGYR